MNNPKFEIGQQVIATTGRWDEPILGKIVEFQESLTSGTRFYTVRTSHMEITVEERSLEALNAKKEGD
jgi:hypothetical protein